MNHRVLLHILSEQAVDTKLDELPYRADSHRKAEREQTHEERGEVHSEFVRPVENVNQSETDSRADKAVEGVKYRVPDGDPLVERGDLAENVRAEHEGDDDYFQRVRKSNIQPSADKARNHKEHERQKAGHCVFVVLPYYAVNQSCGNHASEYDIYYRLRFVVPDFTEIRITGIKPESFFIHIRTVFPFALLFY